MAWLLRFALRRLRHGHVRGGIRWVADVIAVAFNAESASHPIAGTSAPHRGADSVLCTQVDGMQGGAGSERRAGNHGVAGSIRFRCAG